MATCLCSIKLPLDPGLASYPATSLEIDQWVTMGRKGILSLDTELFSLTGGFSLQQ